MKALMAAPTEPADLSVKDLERIFRENHALVFRAAYRITANAGDAEDVLQTVFLRMLKREPDAEPVGNMPSFLHRAAVNAALDLVRSRQNIRNIPLDELEPVLAEPASRSPERAQSFQRNPRLAARRPRPPQPPNRADVRPPLLRGQR